MNDKKNKSRVILVVDDSQDTLELLHRNLEHMGYSVFSCDNAKEAIDILKENHVDLVITDYHMPFIGGIDVIRHVRENYKNTEVMMITGYASVEGAVEAIKAGAEEYLSKPFTDEELQGAIDRSMEKLAIRSMKTDSDKKSIAEQYGIIGESEGMKKVSDSIRKATSNNMPVLISGESGTGKELVARAIHYESEKSGYPFFHVNCRGIPETILESEIFGYSRSETANSVNEVRKGFLEMAEKGTVFFDEISSTSLSTQVKLLRALSGEITPIGDTKPRNIECRIMASTSRDLLFMVRKGFFREDLFFKLNGINIVLPPLKDRGKDIVMIANAVLAQASYERGVAQPPVLGEKVVESLLNYPWPGNVRELERTIREISGKTEGGIIEVPDLPSSMRFNVTEESQLNRTLLDVELDHIKFILAKVEGNKTKAAELLGIDRKTLREKLKKRNTEQEN
jgi:two-component system, NtrC family, response regulator HydG